MKKIIVVLVLLASVFMVMNIRENSTRIVPVKRCVDSNNPCYQITMEGQPDLSLNSWTHYGSSNCVDFTSLPDGDFHGYCGIYKIVKIN